MSAAEPHVKRGWVSWKKYLVEAVQISDRTLSTVDGLASDGNADAVRSVLRFNLHLKLKFGKLLRFRARDGSKAL